MNKKLRHLLQVIAVCMVFALVAFAAVPTSAVPAYAENEENLDATTQPASALPASTQPASALPATTDSSNQGGGTAGSVDEDVYYPYFDSPYSVYEDFDDEGNEVFNAEIFLPVNGGGDGTATYEMGYWMLDQMNAKLDINDNEYKCIVFDIGIPERGTTCFDVTFPTDSVLTFPNEEKSLEILIPNCGTLSIPAQSFEGVISRVLITLTDEGVLVESFSGDEVLSGIVYEFTAEEDTSYVLVLPEIEEETEAVS